MKKKLLRKNYFIKKDFQGRMILGFFLFIMGSIILFTVIFGMFSADSITITYKDNNLQLGQTPLMLLKNALAANWVFIIFGGSLLIFAALLVSHHIAGPLYRFEKALQNMTQGKLDDHIHLRTHDEGGMLAGSINDFNKLLSGKIREIDQHTRAIEALLDKLEQTAPAATDHTATAENCASIRAHNMSIQKVISFFTPADE